MTWGPWMSSSPASPGGNSLPVSVLTTFSLVSLTGGPTESSFGRFKGFTLVVGLVAVRPYPWITGHEKRRWAASAVRGNRRAAPEMMKRREEVSYFWPCSARSIRLRRAGGTTNKSGTLDLWMGERTRGGAKLGM